jgi:rhodanese-related sulfurtransferase
MFTELIQAFIRPSVKTLKASELNDFRRKNPNAIFIDVRDEVEARDEGLFPGAVRSPLHSQSFLDTLRRFPKNRPTVLLCQTGKRSKMAAERMQKAGFTRLFVVENGLEAWLSSRRRASIPENSAT